MKSRGVKYLFFALYGMLVATGPICMIHLISPVEPGDVVLWLIIPFALLITGAMALVMKVFYRRLFLRQRYLTFALSVWGVAYAVDIIALYTGHYFTAFFHLPHYLRDPYSLLPLFYTVSSSILSVLTMAGFFLLSFYRLHQEQNRYEETYRRRIKEKTESLRRRIRMPEIKSMLHEAATTLKSDPDLANERIQNLSDYLRRNLYDKDRHTEQEQSASDRHWEPESSRTSAFITEKKYRLRRHLTIIGIIGLMSIAMLFEYPDEMFLDPFHWRSCIVTFLGLSALLYANIFLIFPFFLKKNRQRLYGVLLISICATAFIALTVIGTLFGPPYNPFGVRMPWYLIPLSVAGNLMTFFLLMAGSAALVLLKRNILGKWRLSRLEAQTAEIEFTTLQHQINPHTLFNFLNNIAILGYEDPEEASRTLKSLEELLDYIVMDTSRKETTIEEEMRFIRNYITLEKSSGRELDVDICCPERLLRYRIPPLLLLPFVENAVKHSRCVGEGRRIEIEFRPAENGVVFICRNTCCDFPAADATGRKKNSGGLGIANTRRRLQLLFGSSQLLSFDKRADSFTVKLLLPTASGEAPT